MQRDNFDHLLDMRITSNKSAFRLKDIFLPESKVYYFKKYKCNKSINY